MDGKNVTGMWWFVLFVLAWGLCLLFVPLNQWRRLLPSGVIALLLLYLIDSTLISLGALSYAYPSDVLDGLPFAYWLSGMPGGMLLVHFLPGKKERVFPYILLAAGLFLGLEYMTDLLGYIRYGSWSLFKSYLLDIAGFINVVFLWSWLQRDERAYAE